MHRDSLRPQNMWNMNANIFMCCLCVACKPIIRAKSIRFIGHLGKLNKKICDTFCILYIGNRRFSIHCSELLYDLIGDLVYTQKKKSA